METVNAQVLPAKTKRSFWLTAFLIIMFITNPLTAFSYFAYPDALVEVYPLLSTPLIFLMGVLAICNTLLVVATWRWKKIGVYGLYTTITTAFIINLYIGVDYFGAFMGLVGALVIYVTTRKTWAQFS